MADLEDHDKTDPIFKLGFEESPVANHIGVLTDANKGLRLLEPDPQTVFKLSPVLPAASQRIRLTVGAPPGTVAVTYQMDGHAIGAVDSAPWAVWWPLTLGDHQLVATARLADGSQQTTDARAFSVTDYAPPESHDVGP